MKPHLHACVHVAEFAAQALLRLHPVTKGTAVAVLDGPAHDERICALNRKARQLGAVHELTRLDAESLPNLHLLARNPRVEESARAVLIEVALQFTPRVEEVFAEGACSLVLDMTGTERLFGAPAEMAAQIRAAITAAGLQATLAVSANYDVARMLARARAGTTIVPQGSEADWLAKLPVDALACDSSTETTFTLWGVRTLGDLAALPEDELVARCGAAAAHWHQLARGIARHTMQPLEQDFELREVYAFDSPVESMESLLFVAARMLECLVQRATAHALAIATLTIHCALEGGATHERVIRPALPSVDRKQLLKLAQLEMGAHPPQATVLTLTLTATPGTVEKVQLGLFAPETPEAAQLDVTLARLKRVVGEQRVGATRILDTHHPSAYADAPLETIDVKPVSDVHEARVAMRRVRPARCVDVVMLDAKPVAMRDCGEHLAIQAAYGPWRSSGNWWCADAWDWEEWDVMAIDGAGESFGCLLVNDVLRKEWRLEALFD